jgi:hypothetical protein
VWQKNHGGDDYANLLESLENIRENIPVIYRLYAGASRPGERRRLMYWTVVCVMGTLVLLMLAVSVRCLVRELKHAQPLSDIVRAVLADEER